MTHLEEQALALIKKQRIYKTWRDFERNVLDRLNEGCPRYLTESSEGHLTVVCWHCKKVRIRFSCETLPTGDLGNFLLKEVKGLHKQ